MRAVRYATHNILRVSKTFPVTIIPDVSLCLCMYRHAPAWTVLSKWQEHGCVLRELFGGQNLIDKVVTLVK